MVQQELIHTGKAVKKHIKEAHIIIYSKVILRWLHKSEVHPGSHPSGHVPINLSQFDLSLQCPHG